MDILSLMKIETEMKQSTEYQQNSYKYIQKGQLTNLNNRSFLQKNVITTSHMFIFPTSWKKKNHIHTHFLLKILI